MNSKVRSIFTNYSIVGFSFIFITISANATTYYIDYVDGSNSNNGTSSSTPWKHIPGDSSATGNAASTTPSAGDSICVKGGTTYSSGNTITLKSSGTSGSRIIYDGNCSGFGNGDKAILNSGTGIYIASKDYVTIKNFEFANYPDSVIWQDYQQYPDDSIGVTVDSNYIHDGWVSQQGSVSVWNSQNFTLSNNIFEYSNAHREGFGTHTGGNSSTTLTDSTKSWTESEQSEFIGKNIMNHNYSDCSCSITSATATTLVCSGGLSCGWHNGDGYGIADGGRGPTYFQCRFDGSNCVSDSTGTVVNGNTFHYYGNSPLFFFGQDQLTASNNIITGLAANTHSQGLTHYNANVGKATISNNYYNGERSFMTVEGLVNIGTGGVKIINNITNNNNGAYITACWGPPGISGGTVWIINNTFLNNGGHATLAHQWGSCTMDIVFRNNITDGEINVGSVQTNNCYTHSDSGTETGAVYNTDLSAIFKSTAFDSTDDYELLSNSPCMDKGMDASIYDVSEDFAGNPRPYNNTYDMGAYEYTEQQKLNTPTIFFIRQ